MARDILDWSLLLLNHWQYSLGGGGIGGLIVLIIYLIERANGESMNKSWFFLVVILLVLGGSFGAWQDKNKALIALKERLASPEFDFKIGGVYQGQFNGQPLVVVDGAILHPAGPQSGIIGWKMTVEFPNGKQIIGEVPLPPGEDYKIPISSMKNTFITIHADKYFPNTSANPIMSGGVLQGWFWSTFPSLDFKEAHDKHALIIIEFQDVVTNKTHKFTKKPEWAGIHIPAQPIQMSTQTKQPSSAEKILEELIKKFDNPVKPISTEIVPHLQVTPDGDIQERLDSMMLKVHILNYSKYVARNILVDIKFGDSSWRHELWKATQKNASAQILSPLEIVDKYLHLPNLKELKSGKSADINMYDMNKDWIVKLKMGYLKNGKTTPIKPEESTLYQESQGWKEKIDNTESGKPIKIFFRTVWENIRGQQFDQTVEYQLICTKVGTGKSYTFLPIGNIIKNYE